MIIRFLAAAALCVVASAVPAKTVIWDEGGLINPRGQEGHDLIERGEKVRILGICLSACTMYLAVPDVCVSRHATLMFHGPFSVDGPISDEQYRAGVTWMADYYPPFVADWFQMIGHDGMHWMTGQVLIDLGVKDCAGY